MAAGAGALPEVPEQEASGELADLYADIRAVVGTSVVPLVYRHVATLPGCLAWCWAVLRPLYASGRLAGAAERLMEAIEAPPVPPLSAVVLRAAGVDGEGAAMIGRILDVYNRSNPMNLVGLSALLRLLHDPGLAAGGGAEAAAGPASAAPPAGLDALPRMLAPEEMAPATAEVIYELAGLGAEAPRRSMGSVHRLLAHWPGYLPLAVTVLRPLEANGWLQSMMQRVRERLNGEADAVLADLPPVPAPPEGEAREALEAGVQPFAASGLIRILPITKALRHTLPAG